jgi:hypothetical protein
MAPSHYVPIYGCLPFLYRILVLHSCRGYRAYRVRGNRYLSIHGRLQSWYGSGTLHILCGVIRKLDYNSCILRITLTGICTAIGSTRYRHGIRNSHMLGFQFRSRIDMASSTRSLYTPRRLLLLRRMEPFRLRVYLVLLA